MSKAKEIFNVAPPALLYHYTTQQGLLGILRNKDIWATHTQYLNDTREFRHALDLVREELSAKRKEVTDRPAVEWLTFMEQALSMDLETVNVCVCSFSESGDALSQWRAYGSTSSGFAMGFAGPALKEVSSEYGWLTPVIYDEDKQRLLVRSLLDDVLQELLTGHISLKEAPPGGSLTSYLNRYAPILKHKSFEEEREWRIITRPLSCKFERFDFREGSSMVIPYFRLPLDKQDQIGLREIVIGPTPHPDQSYRSVHSLLLKNGVNTSSFFGKRFVTVRHSAIPYRSW